MLQSQKAADFILFTRIVKLIKNKMHLTEEGLLQIINLRASINLGLSNLKNSKFPNYKPVARPVNNTTKIPDPNWIAGFVTAEGCFFLSLFKSNRTKIGYAIQLMFKLTQNKRDKEILELVAKFMNCGAVYSHG